MTPPLPILRPCNVSRANLRRASSINGLSAKGLGLPEKKKKGGEGDGGWKALEILHGKVLLIPFS